MFKVKPLDGHVTHEEQMEDGSPGPVVLVNIFHLEPEDAEEFASVWGGIIRGFKSEPGFISVQLHRGTAGSGTFLVYSVWESVARYRAVMTNPDFQGELPAYPDGTVATPHLFRKVAVENVCVA